MMQTLFTMKNATWVVLILLVIGVVALIPILHLQMSQGSEGANKEVLLNNMIEKDVFAVSGDLAARQKLSADIDSLRTELVESKYWTDHQFLLSISKQAYGLYLGMTAMQANPPDSENEFMKYLRQHMDTLNKYITSRITHNKALWCSILQMEQKENKKWLETNPFGTTLEGMANASRFRTNMEMVLHDTMIQNGCIKPTPSVKTMIQQ